MQERETHPYYLRLYDEQAESDVSSPAFSIASHANSMLDDSAESCTRPFSAIITVPKICNTAEAG